MNGLSKPIVTFYSGGLAYDVYSKQGEVLRGGQMIQLADCREIRVGDLVLAKEFEDDLEGGYVLLPVARLEAGD